MTNTKAVTIEATTEENNGVVGQYNLEFTAKGISPEKFMEDFLGENIKSMTITEDEIYLINKQGNKQTVEVAHLGLNSIEHLDQNQQDEEETTYHPNGL